MPLQWSDLIFENHNLLSAWGQINPAVCDRVITKYIKVESRFVKNSPQRHLVRTCVGFILRLPSHL